MPFSLWSFPNNLDHFYPAEHLWSLSILMKWSTICQSEGLSSRRLILRISWYYYDPMHSCKYLQLFSFLFFFFMGSIQWLFHSDPICSWLSTIVPECPRLQLSWSHYFEDSRDQTTIHRQLPPRHNTISAGRTWQSAPSPTSNIITYFRGQASQCNVISHFREFPSFFEFFAHFQLHNISYAHCLFACIVLFFGSSVILSPIILSFTLVYSFLILSVLLLKWRLSFCIYLWLACKSSCRYP